MEIGPMYGIEKNVIPNIKRRFYSKKKKNNDIRLPAC